MDVVVVAMLAAVFALGVANIVTSLKKNGGSAMPPGLEGRLASMEASLGRFDPMIRGEFVRNREESGKAARESREELSGQQEKMRAAIDLQLKEIRTETEKRLEEMRKTVDESLKETVEKRFNDSFKLISDRLEQVHKGLGEMKQLASGVDDLKKVLSNVKTKGNLGEVQLGSILEQVLSPGQFEAQAAVRGGSLERVDYVIKLPDKNSMDRVLLLPIDSKFPTEDYQRLLDAYDSGLPEADMRGVSNSFEASVRRCAKEIREKYVNPPVTTDFAIMFVPTEGLYAEIVRRTGLFESLQRTHKVTVVGPTNLAAFLSSLQMGFRTLAIERRSNEVWELLGAVKTEFGKFGDVMDNIKRKIDSAAKEIDTVGVRSRAIERRLRSVGELPAGQSALLIDGRGDEVADERM
ncbi:MAG: DNA recombination protein RmuC [Methanomassiliicoccaceae archaeon]|nr:DNA recombination protein RmuC [Methanomassiliicoccaceae archaeon]